MYIYICITDVKSLITKSAIYPKNAHIDIRYVDIPAIDLNLAP